MGCNACYCVSGTAGVKGTLYCGNQGSSPTTSRTLWPLKIKALSSFTPWGTTNPAIQHHIPNLKHISTNKDHDGDTRVLQVKKWYCLGLQNFILFNQNEIKFVPTVHLKYKNYLCYHTLRWCVLYFLMYFYFILYFCDMHISSMTVLCSNWNTEKPQCFSLFIHCNLRLCIQDAGQMQYHVMGNFS